MDEPNQIVVPPSFLALFTSPGGHRLLEPMAAVRERYELCEDLAQMVAEQVATASFGGGNRREVLGTIQAALAGAGSDLPPGQAQWVAIRVAELLGWELPQPDGAAP